MYATQPETAKKMEKHHPKGQEPPEKRRKKAAFFEGFYSHLEKTSSEADLLQRIMARVERDKIRKAYRLEQREGGEAPAGVGSLRSSAETRGPGVPDLLPTGNAKSSTRLKLEILRDSSLSNSDKNALLARLEKRPEVSGPDLRNRMLMGAALPSEMRSQINAYLAAKRSPRSSSFLQRILRLGMLSSQAITKGPRFHDRRRRPEEERPSRWKTTPI